MQPETKTCQSCKKEFVIEPEDFAFYEKMKVPAPTWCPECRMVRRMVWRNERSLFNRVCGAPGHSEKIFSIISPDEPHKVYDQQYWWSDENDPQVYARDYDFSKPFFSQIAGLLKDVPQNNLVNKNNLNCDYTNYLITSKNCYLVFGGMNNENLTYASHVFNIRDSMELYFSDKLELSYENSICLSSFRLFFSSNCENCTDSILLADCRNCINCFACVGLRNKQYCLFNEQLSKEEYNEKISKYNLGSYATLKKLREDFANYKKKFPVRYVSTLRVQNSTGDNITDAKNCKIVFDCLAGGSEDSKYVFWTGAGMKDIYDGVACGVGGSELCYEVATGAGGTSRSAFVSSVWGGHDIFYSINCHNSCHDIFACIGLRGKSYCILNKQYTKEEYEKLVPKIIEHMNTMPYIDCKGRGYKYGEFFPSEISPFAYNETMAQEYFSLTKEQALEKGYKWREPDTKNYVPTKYPEDLPDHIEDVSDSVTTEILACAHAGTGCNEMCATAFRVIPQELAFYRRMNLPLPRICPNCRHFARLKLRNPLRLWHRKCMKPGCENEFETSYAPDRPEIVYCESCYQQEVV